MDNVDNAVLKTVINVKTSPIANNVIKIIIISFLLTKHNVYALMDSSMMKFNKSANNVMMVVKPVLEIEEINVIPVDKVKILHLIICNRVHTNVFYPVL